MYKFNGMNMNLGNLSKLSNAISRSITAENFTGAKGKGGMATEGTGAYAARELGQGWKISPSVTLKANSTYTVAEIDGPGSIQHIWFTMDPAAWRFVVLRMYWDGEDEPSVEVPIGDFFCNGWCERSNVMSIPIMVGPAGGFNSYWELPFRKSAKITIENPTVHDTVLFYQVDYILTNVPKDVAYFHATWRRSNPLPYKTVHTIVDGIEGKGQYVGTYLAWQSNNTGWWGEGEVKFYMDGDSKFPTICGTGTEDYIGGAWDFEQPTGEYCKFSAPYSGFHQIIKPDGLYRSQMRFGMYRWHVMDPVRFNKDLKVTIQALSWRTDGRYLPLQDDIASTAFWYQTEPHNPFPPLPDADAREVI